ncbi:amidase [Paroceanicella profunda]|nr:amidase [Paroceanicella profunda]
MVMPIHPTEAEIAEIGASFGAAYTPEDTAFLRQAISGFVAAANATLQLPDNLPEVRYPRTPGTQPGPEENPLNAWYVKSTIEGAAEGPLKGKTVVLKDNVLVAGMRCMNGAGLMEGYVPEVDATVVTRLLDAGATVLGKAHCEYFCLSGSSHTNDTGHVLNPVNPAHSAGGSSSGSGALVASGEADLAIGGDQGGSIRMPASFCGIVGLKPTHSLVPYSGIMSMEVTIDHTGPMTRTVADNAAMLEVLAGPDGWDMRQGVVTTHPYADFVGKGVEGMRIGILSEGFGRPESDPEVDACVRAAAAKLAALGAVVEEVSVPAHDEIGVFFMPMIAEGMVRQFTYGQGLASGASSFYPPSLIEKYNAIARRANDFPDTVNSMTVFGAWVMKKFGGRIYAKGQNLRPLYARKYAEVFARYDLLLMPTTAHAAPELPAPGTPRMDFLTHAWTMLGNTAPYDYTGHPAMSLPCGMTSKGLPVGLQLVAEKFNEPAIYRAAGAFEASHDWRSL